MILRIDRIARTALLLTAACLVAMAAQAQQSKQELASRLAQLQVRIDGEAIAEQLADQAVQPLVAAWSERLHEMPGERQTSAAEQLDAELEKFKASARQAIGASLPAAAEAALAPIFMERLTEDDLKVVIAYMESPASGKMQALGGDASNAWAAAVVDSTRGRVETSLQAFDAAAARIVTAASPPRDGRPGQK